MSAPVKTSDKLTFGKSYFDQAFGDVDSLIENAETQLIGLDIKFDSMVGIGLSGLLVLPILARHFDVPFLALRKPNVESHDTDMWGGTNFVGQFGRGTIGKRWILVDDFVSTGTTMRNAETRVKAGIKAENPDFRTKFVGCYCYGSNYGESYGKFVYPNLERGYVVKIDVDGEPYYVNGEIFRVVKRQIKLNRWATDPKGEAISYVRDEPYYMDKVDLDELAMMAVAAEKQLREED